MIDDDRNIVSGPPRRWRWSWPRARARDLDLDLGTGPRRTAGIVDVAPRSRPAQGKTRPARASRRPPRFDLQQAPLAVPWKRWPATAVILAALFFHAAPHLALIGSALSAEDARLLIYEGVHLIPWIGELEPERWLAPAASAWLWQPIAVVAAAALIRFVALSMAGRYPLGAVWVAVLALAVDGVSWLHRGLSLWGVAYTPAEGEALLTLLKVEGGALVILLFLFSRRRAKA
ncbi:hypothetical protein [Caulobacter mirabilis]|uniref:Uncharacterized protein n=1 Tax=Caulobacter mirabilis TaxID=69666 RepID=A0A2D2B2M4_9CAUL|nr:hypothetical protein [Caulobacter mirabilis]ATQ44505.1 hypothetical protein CSW64_20005 [Caulobacter mirabilis]